MNNAAPLVKLLRAKKLKISLAESCTGGLLAKQITDVEHASEVFECGFVTYSDRIKQDVLGVDPRIIARHTVYSAHVAAAMAERCAQIAGADIGVGVTGVAGPADEGQVKAGSVWYGLYAARDGKTVTRALKLPGDRIQVRQRAAEEIFGHLCELLGR